MSSAVLAVYHGVWRVSRPFIAWFVKRKDIRRGMDAITASERFGVYQKYHGWSEPGFTIWIHGASVGECLSAIPIIETVLGWKQWQPRVVLSTTTAAARSLLAKRLSNTNRTAVVFAPLDSVDCVQKFYQTWRIDAGLFIESELWPTLITEAAKRKIPLGLINGRVSTRSFGCWRLPFMHSFITSWMPAFSMVLCQGSAQTQRFQKLGASKAEDMINLKFAASASTGTNKEQVKALDGAIDSRHAWLAVSTHKGEEEIMVDAHVQSVHNRQDGHDLLTILAPRHPHRVPSIQRHIHEKYPHLKVSIRSKDRLPTPATDIFIVDSLGETDVLFRVVSTVVMGGSFSSRGGHNPIEPLRHGCKVVVGPNMTNFDDILDTISSAERERNLPSSVTKTTASQLPFHLHSLPPCSSSHRKLMTDLSIKTLDCHMKKLSAWLE